MIVTQILARISANVLDLPTEVQHNVEAYMQSSILSLELLHNFSCMRAELVYVTSSTPALGANQTHVIGQIPAGWKAPRGLPYYVMYIGTVQQLEWLPEREYVYRSWNAADINQVGAPCSLLIGEAQNLTIPDPSNPDFSATNLNIEVYPFPDGSSDWADGNYRIHTPYWSYLTIPNKDSDTNWFCQNAFEFIIAAATQACYEAASLAQASTYWSSKAWGPKWDGRDMHSLGGWARRAIVADAGVIGTPSKVIRVRRDYYAQTGQWRQ